MATILIIDDNEKILYLFKRFLESHGHVISCAINGCEGLRMLESSSPELVITDIIMPETDGLEVVMAIKKMAVDIPVIAVSGGTHAMPADFLMIAKKFGARKVLYKPVELHKLLHAVNEVLSTRDSRSS